MSIDAILINQTLAKTPSCPHTMLQSAITDVILKGTISSPCRHVSFADAPALHGIRTFLQATMALPHASLIKLPPGGPGCVGQLRGQGQRLIDSNAPESPATGARLETSDFDRTCFGVSWCLIRAE
jgi:hypothetical protein